MVHDHRTLKIVGDENFVRSIVARLTRRHEATEPKPWKMGDAPRGYLDKMVSLIVGVQV